MPGGGEEAVRGVGGGGAEGVRGLRVRLQMSLGFGDVWGLGFRV